MRVVVCAILVTFLCNCSRSPGTYLERGNALYRAGKYSQAQFQYRVSISKDPHFAEGYYRLALADLELGLGADALNALQQAVAFDPGNEEYAVKFADISIEAFRSDSTDKRSYDQAQEIATKLLAKNPNSSDGLRLKGELLILDRKYDEALAELRKADAMRPLDPAVNVPMVQALLTENQAQQAESLGLRVLKAHADSSAMYDVLANYYSKQHRLADLERLLKSEVRALPAESAPRLRLARLYLDSGRQQDMAGVLNQMDSDRAHFPNAPRLLGDFYAERGNWAAALHEYQAGDRSDVKDKQVYEKGIARAMAALGQTQGSIEELSAVLKANPGDSTARLARAILLRTSSAPADRDLAVSDLKSLVRASPSDPVAIYNLGLADIAHGDTSQGITQLKQAAALRGDYAAPRLALAELAEKNGDHASTISLTEEVLAADANNLDAELLHASGLIGTKDYTRARNELQALLQRNPDSLDVNLQMAALDAAENKYSDAETLYLRLYKSAGNDLRPLQALVELYLKETQPKKADGVLQQALSQNPDAPQIHLLAAQTAAQEGNRERAIQQYQWLAAKNPKSVETLTALGDVYQQQGDMPHAVASYQKAAELAPRDENVLNSLAILETDSGQTQAAIATLTKELALKPGDASVMNNLAFNLAETGSDLNRAQALAAEAARSLSGDPDVLDTLGWVYTKRGLNQSAIQVFRVLVKKNPNRPMYRYHLGVALLQDNQSAQAKSEFTAALSQNPPKDLADKIRQASARLQASAHI